MSLAPEQQFGKYRIEGLLGRGAMGEVFLAEDTALRRRIVLKLLPATVVENEERRREFFQEARAVAALTHANIVHVNAFDIIEGHPVLEMEYVPDGSLADHLRKRIVSPSRAVRYAHGVAAALDYCHCSGMVHRDVKPANVLIQNQTVAKLTDFGLVKMLLPDDADLATLTQTGTFKGTPQYVPPEAWEGAKPLPAWDLYGLGAVLYRVLAGTPPYSGTTQLELAHLVANSTPSPLRDLRPDLSQELCQLVDELLARTPERRPGTAAEVVERLEALPEFSQDVEADEETLALPPISPHGSRRPRARSTRSRPSWRAAALLVLLVLLVTAGSWLTWNRPVETPAPSAGNNPSAELLLDIEEFVAGSDTSRQAHWFVRRDENGAPKALWGHAPGLLSHAEFTPLENTSTYRLTGEWGAYLDRHGTRFEWGTLEGLLRWHDTGPACMGELEYLLGARADGYHVTLLGGVSEPVSDPVAAFTRRIELGDHALPLLHNELLPRGLAWSAAIEQLLPGPGALRLDVPAYPERTEDALELDGAFTEPLWQLASDALPAATKQDSSATLRLVQTRSRLCLAVEVQSGRPLQLEMTLQGLHAVPLSAGFVARSEVTRDHCRLVVESPARKARALVDACHAHMRVVDGFTRIEAAFSLSALHDAGVLLPGATRIRATCVLRTATAQPGTPPWAAWSGGDADVETPGLLLAIYEP